MKTQTLGTFVVESGKLMVSDPCYERGTWCQGVLSEVQNGTWVAIVRLLDNKETHNWGERVAELIVVRQGEEDLRWTGEKQGFDAGVDSGQMAIVDYDFWPEGSSTGECGDETSFYGLACECTINDRNESAGILDLGGLGPISGKVGVVSSSGYGDGGYDCYVRRAAGSREIDGVRVVFIGDKERITI